MVHCSMSHRSALSWPNWSVCFQMISSLHGRLIWCPNGRCLSGMSVLQLDHIALKADCHADRMPRMFAVVQVPGVSASATLVAARLVATGLFSNQ